VRLRIMALSALGGLGLAVFAAGPALAASGQVGPFTVPIPAVGGIGTVVYWPSVNNTGVCVAAGSTSIGYTAGVTPGPETVNAGGEKYGQVATPGVGYSVTTNPLDEHVYVVPNPNSTVVPTITLPSVSGYGGPHVTRVYCSVPVTIIT
jgi:hypothetical protein